MIYQILDDEGAVINTINADEAFVQAHYPDHYRLVPEPPVVVPKRFILTRAEFRGLFTFQELVAIATAAKTDVAVEVFMTSAENPTIDLTYPEVTEGLAYLVSLTLITQQKMDNILEGV